MRDNFVKLTVRICLNIIFIGGGTLAKLRASMRVMAVVGPFSEDLG